MNAINPYLTTDADCGFPSGDAFLVYPGKDGKPEESIRLMVLQEAFRNCPKINSGFHIRLTSPCRAATPVNREVISGQILNDYRLFKLLESKTSKEFVMGIIEDEIEPITFSKFPHGEDYLLTVRQNVLNALKQF